jgi:RHS repeat-associated protein
MRTASYLGAQLNYTYDDDGNVLTRSAPSAGNSWAYNWSSDNRLLGGTSTVFGTESLEYDALGQPVVTRGGSDGHIVRVTLYDGGNVLADLDSVGNRQGEYVYDAGTDRPYALLTGPTTVTGEQYFIQDALGNVQGTFTGSGGLGQSIEYKEWGYPTAIGDGTNRLMWKGLPFDSVLSLTHIRARWYDPRIGRFVSEDPIGLAGGINPYMFANNDPINGFDPSGMSSDPNDICGSYGFGVVSFSNGYSTCTGYWLAAVPVTAPADPSEGDITWSYDDPIAPLQSGDGASGGNNSTPGTQSKVNRMACASSVAGFGITALGDVAFFTGIGARFFIIGAREARIGEMFAEGAAQGINHLRTARALRGLGSGSIATVTVNQWGVDGIQAALIGGASHWRDWYLDLICGSLIRSCVKLACLNEVQRSS